MLFTTHIHIRSLILAINDAKSNCINSYSHDFRRTESNAVYKSIRINLIHVLIKCIYQLIKKECISVILLKSLYHYYAFQNIA